MDNFIFCLNATIPVFLLMMLGCFLRRINFINQDFADKLNNFVFKAALPVLLFNNISNSDFTSVWDTKFVGFCFVISLICILIMVAVSKLLKDKSIRGEFIQAGFRSSQALLGVAFMQNLYGKACYTVPLMMIATIPLYNISSVAILTLANPNHTRTGKDLWLKTLKGIVTNPLIIGMIAGIIWSLIKIPQPVIMQRAVTSVSATATPLGLIALGASFNFKKAGPDFKPAMAACFFKLIIFAALFLPIAMVLGFRGEKLVTVLIMLAAPTTVSSFTMARSMGHDGTLSASSVLLTTLFSALTLTGWFYLIRYFGLM